MRYEGDRLREIIFPLGGIGTGSIGLAGNGRLVDWEIFNRPNKGSDNGYTHFAVRSERADGIETRVLNGDHMKDLMGQYSGGVYYSGYGYGPGTTTMAGFRHFSCCTFEASFPTAKVLLSDPDSPLKVSLEAFNPMIPNDSKNSSIPGAFFEIKVKNCSAVESRLSVACALANPFEVSRNKALNSGVFLENAGAAGADPAAGDLTLLADGGEVFVQESWYRGRWQDGVATYWREMNSPEGLRRRSYDDPGKKDVCTVLVSKTVRPGESMTARFLIAWNIPNCYNYWDPLKDDDGRDITWRNWYATVWPDSRESAAYAMGRWDELYRRTVKFRDTLWSAAVPEPVLEAAADTLSVLKSPTVLRLEDGTLYGWEGCHERAGSCEGSCTHVWNYAYAMCFLFPDLERSMREVDFRYNQQPDGAMRFRMTLPLGRPGGWKMPCADGQMGGILKTYREWKLCGDDAWLRKIWPAAKRSLEYAWSPDSLLGWDRDKDGVLEGRQHHTLDMELYGPSSWLEGMYLAALKAAAEMAEHLGETESAAEYRELLTRGQAWTEENLFNGRWYFQKIDLTDRSILERYSGGESTLGSHNSDTVQEYWNTETGEIKYQIGEGSSIDQMLGQWHADICGLGDIFDPVHRRTALETMWEYNYQPSFRGFTNPWRNFVLNDEAGTLICAYPDGAKKPAIPVPYCEETMHGFEYEFAGLLMAEGAVEKGTAVAKAVRDRYDGRKRNPFNEIECGNNYARSMASFAMLMILSGFQFDLPHGRVGFDPVQRDGTFRCIWSVDGAWGDVSIDDAGARIHVLEGELRANRFALPFLKSVSAVKVDGAPASFTFENGEVVLAAASLSGELEVLS